MPSPAMFAGAIPLIHVFFVDEGPIVRYVHHVGHVQLVQGERQQASLLVCELAHLVEHRGSLACSDLQHAVKSLKIQDCHPLA